MTMLILGLFIGGAVGYITAALMAAPNYSEIPTSSTAKDNLAVQEEETEIGWAIERIEDMKKGIYLVYPESLYDFILKTLQKHQKIEEIYERFQKEGGYYYHMARLVDALREVLEDGNE